MGGGAIYIIMLMTEKNENKLCKITISSKNGVHKLVGLKINSSRLNLRRF